MQFNETNLNVSDEDTTVLWVYVESFLDLTPSFYLSRKSPLKVFRISLIFAFANYSSFYFPLSLVFQLFFFLFIVLSFPSSLQILFIASSGPLFSISTNSLIFHTELIFAFAKLWFCVIAAFSLVRENMCDATWARLLCRQTHLLQCLIFVAMEN